MVLRQWHPSLQLFTCHLPFHFFSSAQTKEWRRRWCVLPMPGSFNGSTGHYLQVLVDPKLNPAIFLPLPLFVAFQSYFCRPVDHHYPFPPSHPRPLLF